MSTQANLGLVASIALTVSACSVIPRGPDPTFARTPSIVSTMPPHVIPTHAGEPNAQAPKRDQAVATAIAFAEAQVGKAYCRGGEGPSCFDCSGLIQASYAQAGIRVPRVSDDLARSLREVPADEARAGDIAWWPGHVGLYLGNGEIIDARGKKTGVVRRALRYAPARMLRPT